MKGPYALLLLALALFPLRTQAVSVFEDNFSTPTSTAWSYGSGVAVNTSIWSMYNNGNFGSRINGGRLEITSRRSSSAHGQGFAYVPCGGAGSQFDNAVYNSVLADNGALVTWTFNMRKSASAATTNGGFGCSSSSSQNGITTGLGFILGSSSESGILSSTSNCNPNGTAVGYAVLHGGNNRIRLVHFENSIHNGSISNIAESQTLTYSNYHSVRVTYNPATNAWTLEVRSDGSNSFTDPSQGTYPAPASGVDATHVNTALNFMGGYFQSGCIGNCEEASSGYIALFDNVRVDVACVPPVSPGPIAGLALVCQSAVESYTIAAVPGVNSYAWAYSGAGVALIENGTSVQLTFGTAATSGVLSVSTVGDCASAPQNFPITVQLIPGAPVVSGPALVCEGSLQSYSVPQVTGATSTWTWPAGWSGPVSGATVAVTAGATGGSVSVISTNSCGSGPAGTLDIVVDPAPEVGLEGFPLICTSTPEFQLTGGSPAGGVYTFNGVPVSSFNPIVGVGSYTIVYTYGDTNGCSASAQQELVVDACAGIVELEAGSVRVYPNPASGSYLNIQAPEPGDLLLHDATGRVVAKAWYAATGTPQVLDISGQAPGSYILSFVTRQGAGRRVPVILQ